MSRHTTNDGKTPDRRILPHFFTERWVHLAPEPKLIGAYTRGEVSWETFEESYLISLQKPAIITSLLILANRARRRDITLVCIEATPEKCHRRLLAEECKKHAGALLQLDIN